MLFLVLHRYNEPRTMMPASERKDEYNEFNLPIDLLGPFEVHEKGSLIQLRANMGNIIVKETTEKIRHMISEMIESMAG